MVHRSPVRHQQSSSRGPGSRSLIGKVDKLVRFPAHGRDDHTTSWLFPGTDNTLATFLIRSGLHDVPPYF